MQIKEVDKRIAEADEVVDVEIYDEAGELYTDKNGKPCTIGVVGAESKRYREAEARLQQEGLNRRGPRRLAPAEIDKRAVSLIASCVVRWSGWYDGAKEASCTPENVKQVLRLKHIRLQVDTAIHQHRAFFENSSQSS